MNIVAIGGGEIKTKETLRIDRFIVELTGKSSPRALFVPTASGDAEGYCRTFDNIYGKVLGCRTDHLLLLAKAEELPTVEERIKRADLIYVGGGNTLRMMRRWRQLGIDRLMEDAGNDRTVLSGLSAGAICWHAWGCSDSRSFSRNADWSFIRVKGLGFCRGMFCPHLDAEKRKAPFKDMVHRRQCMGIACDNNAAIWYDGHSATVKTSHRHAAAYAFRPEGDRVAIAEYREGQKIEGITTGAFACRP